MKKTHAVLFVLGLSLGLTLGLTACSSVGGVGGVAGTVCEAAHTAVTFCDAGQEPAPLEGQVAADVIDLGLTARERGIEEYAGTACEWFRVVDRLCGTREAVPPPPASLTSTLIGRAIWDVEHTASAPSSTRGPRPTIYAAQTFTLMPDLSNQTSASLTWGTGTSEDGGGRIDLNEFDSNPTVPKAVGFKLTKAGRNYGWAWLRSGTAHLLDLGTGVYTITIAIGSRDGTITFRTVVLTRSSAGWTL